MESFKARQKFQHGHNTHLGVTKTHKPLHAIVRHVVPNLSTDRVRNTVQNAPKRTAVPHCSDSDKMRSLCIRKWQRKDVRVKTPPRPHICTSGTASHQPSEGEDDSGMKANVNRLDEQPLSQTHRAGWKAVMFRLCVFGILAASREVNQVGCYLLHCEVVV